MCGAKRPRQFNFDMTRRKYVYFRTPEEKKDVETKQMKLALCEYEIQSKEQVIATRYNLF